MLCYCIEIKPWWKFVLSNEPKLYFSINLIPVLDLKINRACHLDEKEICKGKANRKNISEHINVAANVSEFRTNLYFCCNFMRHFAFTYIYWDLSELSFSITNVRRIEWSSCFYLYFLFTRKRDNFIVHVLKILRQFRYNWWYSRRSFKLSKKYFRFLSFTVALMH